jgi:hypothetical protein
MSRLVDTINICLLVNFNVRSKSRFNHRRVVRLEQFLAGQEFMKRAEGTVSRVVLRRDDGRSLKRVPEEVSCSEKRTTLNECRS